jgi:hypothetical protein
MCVLLLWLLFGFNIHKWNLGFITLYLYDVFEKSFTIFVVSLLGVKTEVILKICVHY